MLIADLGEDGLIEALRRLFPATSEDLILGIGDDAAVIDVPAGTEQVWTTDMLVEGVHFQEGWQSPEELGRKCLLVNISDIAAMGARPRYALISLAVPPDRDAEGVIGICRGIKEAADANAIDVIGGDSTASGDGLVINIALGGTAEGPVVTRSGARVGDIICVTGYLGQAAAGLRLLQAGETGAFPPLIKDFIFPEPRVTAGVEARTAGVSAMTDISDGLATDLRHICAESSVGACIYSDKLPVSTMLRNAAESYGWEDWQRLVLSGGEDYELLFTIPPAEADAAIAEIGRESGLAVSAIGEITGRENGVTIIDAAGNERPLTEKGYEHFVDR